MAAAQSFQHDLETLHTQMKSEIHFKTARFEELVKLSLNHLELNLCPAVVFAVTRALAKDVPNMIPLASLFQYIFLSDKVHRLVTDGDIPEDQRQYPILVGDYLFGQAFKKLCEKDLFPHLKEFTKLIEDMNQGVIQRWSLKDKPMLLDDYKLILGKEKASILKLAAKMTAEINDTRENVRNKLERFGYNLGMAWAFNGEGLNSSIKNEYLDKADSDIKSLTGMCLIQPLNELYDYVKINISKS